MSRILKTDKYRFELAHFKKSLELNLMVICCSLRFLGLGIFSIHLGEKVQCNAEKLSILAASGYGSTLP